MRAKSFVFVSCLTAITGPAMAEQSQSAERALFEALMQPDVIAIMSAEGIDYAGQIADEMLMGHVSEHWSTVISQLYDPQQMEEAAFAAFERSLAGQDVDAMLAFYATDPGRQSVLLEVDARRAVSDPDILDAATAAAIDAHGTPRFDQITAYIEVNDLIEKNISAALNDNYAFLLGLYDGGAMDGQTSPESLISDVWAQEAELRSSTSEWVYGFMNMEKRAKVGDALRGGISWRCRVAVNSLPRKGYATCQRLPSPSCPIHRDLAPTHSPTSSAMGRAS